MCTLSIGADPRDSADERFRKRLLLGSCATTSSPSSLELVDVKGKGAVETWRLVGHAAIRPKCGR